MMADTSFLFALYVEEDANHSKALADYESLDGPLVVTDRTLEELVTALTYKPGIAFALSVLEKIKINSSFESCAMTPQDVAGTFNLMKQVRRDLSFNDYALVYLARVRQENLLSYDKKQLSVLKGK